MTATSDQRQQVLFLYTAEAAMDSPVIGWAFHDGSAGAGPALGDASPPFMRASDALSDGWMLLQSTPPAQSPADHDTGEFRYEFVFERRITIT